MANVNFTAILTAVEELLTGQIGTVRTFSETELATGTYPSLNPGEKARRAMVRPRFDVNITSYRKNAATASENSSQAIYDISVRVVCEYKLEHPIIEADRLAIRAQALTDGEQMRQAMGKPGNLTQTLAEVATGLASGLLRFDGFQLIEENFDQRLLRTQVDFTGVALATMAVT